jgi:hypothetical protein
MVESGEQDETGVKTQNNEISKSTVAIDTTAENANLSTFTNLHYYYHYYYYYYYYY